MAIYPADTEYRVQVLDRAFAIVGALAESEAALGPGELVTRLALNKSTVHRLLAVLERNRYVERDGDTGKYRLGVRLVELGSIALARFDLHRIAKPFVERLVAGTGETAHVGILRQSEVISLVNAEGRHSLRTPSTVGRGSPVHCTSQGKVLLAFQDQAWVDEFLHSYPFPRYTDRTIRNAGDFRAELTKVRKHGFGIDDEEFEQGLRCIGAPVRDHSNKVIAAISIAGPAFRVTHGRMPQIIREVVRTAADLSAALGCQSTINKPAAELGTGSRKRSRREG